MFHLSQLARHAVIAATAASMVLLGAEQAAQAAPSRQQAGYAAAASVPVATSTAAKGVFYTAVVTADGGLVVSRVVEPADERAVRARWSLKLTNTQTKRIFDAAVGGATATVIAICQVAAPSGADWICSAGGAVLGAIIRSLGAPGDNDCLGISLRTKWGLPPWEIDAGYVDCR